MGLSSLFLCPWLLAAFTTSVSGFSAISSSSSRRSSSLHYSQRSPSPLALPPSRVYNINRHQNTADPLCRRTAALHSSTSSSDEEADEQGDDESAADADAPTEQEVVESSAATTENKKESRWKRFINSIKPKKKDGEEELSFKQQLAKMGLASVLSYGWVSNMSYCVTVSVAWYIFSKQTGKSPLAPGQWKGFLAVYAGFWVFNNVIRPVRLAAAVAVSPMFDRIVKRIQTKLQVSKAMAIAITVFVANLVGTTALMCLGILLASLCAGVPIFVPK